MVVAYVLVKATTGDVDRLRREIEGIDGVDAVYIVAGDVDLIAKTNTDSTSDVRGIVTSRIRSLEGVEDSQTYIAME